MMHIVSKTAKQHRCLILAIVIVLVGLAGLGSYHALTPDAIRISDYDPLAHVYRSDVINRDVGMVQTFQHHLFTLPIRFTTTHLACNRLPYPAHSFTIWFLQGGTVVLHAEEYCGDLQLEGIHHNPDDTYWQLLYLFLGEGP